MHTLSELLATDDVARALEALGIDDPGGAVLEPVRDYKARHASTMLTFDAVTAAIEQIEAKRNSAMPAG